MAFVPSCSVIIISYNSGSLLPSCLHSIYRAFDGIDGQVIVLDNGSPEPLPASLKSNYPQVRWLESEKNLGFGKACNRAAQEALHPYLFFVNPDTIVSKDTFSAILDYIQTKPSAGIVGCRILNGDGSLQWACRRSFPSPMAAIYKTLGLAALFPKSRRFGAYNLTYLDPEQPAEVDAVSGSFFCLRKELYEEVKGFDEDFFLYGEDLDICYRVQQAGYPNYYFPGTSIIHFKGQSSKTRLIRSYVDFYQAMLIFARKHPSFLHPVPLWMISVGVFFAAALGIFSRLLPEWGRLIMDAGLLAVIGAVASTFALLPLNSIGLGVLGLSTLIPLLALGEYGPRSIEPKKMLRLGLPATLGLAGVSLLWLELPISVLGVSTFGLFGLWFWRRMVFWFQYFHGVFSGRRRRSVLLGSHSEVNQWFVRENLLPGRDILGCVSVLGRGESYVHFLGKVDDLAKIRARTGARELLVVPDLAGHHEDLPVDVNVSGLRMETRLLIGHPDTGTFAMVDLNFLK